MKKENEEKLHFIAITAFVVFIVLGLACANTPPSTSNPVKALTESNPAEIVGVPWAEYTSLPSKDYTVVGAVVLRDTDRRTVMYDLMERVIALKGHDVINVRMTVKPNGDIAAVTAVAIRYTEDTINPDKDGILYKDLSEIEFFLMGYGDFTAIKPDEIIRAPWTGQNLLFPSKNYVAVGAVGVKDTSSAAVLADLMEQAIELGAHDIMNVRLSITVNAVERTRTQSASSSSSNEDNANISSSSTSSGTSRTYIVYEKEVSNASAVAIKYTNENIIPKKRLVEEKSVNSIIPEFPLQRR